MGDTFPELKHNEKKIKDIIEEEEASFGRTLLKVILIKVSIDLFCFFGILTF